jgi:hypothetical protein
MLHSLINKTIVVISQQQWGNMFVSKHHYAVELARKGNLVYFLNPPNFQHRNFSQMIEITASDFHPNLFLINDNISFPFNIKFHFIGLFHVLIRSHVREILKKIGKPVDIVWSFDLAYVYPFRFFPGKALKIFHPVDAPLNKTGIRAATGAQYIFSTDNDILESYAGYHVPKKFINHGIAAEFLATKTSEKTDNIMRVGFSGNLLREDIDRDILLKIIRDNTETVFECWGSSEFQDVSGGRNNDEPTVKFINELKKAGNVILHGAVPTNMLAMNLQRMDAFLICYNISNENRNGPNYHKLMEYFSTGNVTISNYISTYKDAPALVQMVAERESNQSLPALFRKVMGNLTYYNSPAFRKERIAFANDNTYVKQIHRIENILFKEYAPANLANA